MVERNRSFLEKIAPYLLFVFTVVSFVVSNSVLVLISVIFAIVGFIFVNTLQLFNKFRYVHYLGLFFSLLLFVRLYLLLDGSLFYKISFAFIILNFVIIYFLHFSNTIAKNTNSLGIKKENTHDKRFDLETDGDDLDDLDDDLKESNFGDDEGEENLGGDHDDEDDYDDEEDDGKDDDGKDDDGKDDLDEDDLDEDDLDEDDDYDDEDDLDEDKNKAKKEIVKKSKSKSKK